MKNAKPIFATMAAAVVAILTSSAAHADLQYDPNWPRVKCRLQGQSFQWNPNGAPSYQAAAEKCATFGGVDDRREITNPRGTGVIKKEVPVKVRQTPRK